MIEEEQKTPETFEGSEQPEKPSEKKEAEISEDLDNIVEEKVTSRVEPTDRTKHRENGLKENSKPLIWKYSIEEYLDEEDIDDKEVIRAFTEKVEKCVRGGVERDIGVDQYYNFNKPPRKRKIVSKEKLMQESRELTRTNISLVRGRLREIIKEENILLSSTRKLHVQLKQIGYNTEVSSMFSVAAKEYCLRKIGLVKELELLMNRLSGVYSKVLMDSKYVQKCAAFVDKK